MADPFSIIVGTAGLLDVCYRVASYLAEAQSAARKIEADIASLTKEIESLILVNQSLESWAKGIQVLPAGSISPAESRQLDKTCNNVRIMLRNCRETVESLHELLKQVIGKKGQKATTGRMDGIRKVLRRQSKEKPFLQLRHQLSTYHNGLQLLLTTLNVSYTRISQNSLNLTLRHITEISRALGIQQLPLMAPLQSGIDINHLASSTPLSAPRLPVDEFFGFPSLSQNPQVKTIRPKPPAIASQPVLPSTNGHTTSRSTGPTARARPHLPFENRYFLMPQALSPLFTGRESVLSEIAKAFNGPSVRTGTQKRFVIYGLPGSGKTQLCCKFAYDNKDKFFGVFTIDSSTPEAANHSWGIIATLGGIEQNHNAAKQWLSDLEHPWLLIIDNVDCPSILLEDYFPEGHQGLILVTTRNPSLKVYGTIGSGSCSLGELGHDEAIDLLMKAAQVPEPRGASARESASRIVVKFHAHPLALVQAGRTVATGLCSLDNFESYSQRQWQRLRQTSKNSRFHDTGPFEMGVYSSFEIIYRNLEDNDRVTYRDALDLLKIFAFLHFEDIRVDFLIAAVTNPRRERAEAERMRSQVEGSPNPAKPWTQLIKERGTEFLFLLFKLAQPANVLPQVLRDNEPSEPFDTMRLRLALKVLEQLGVITHNEIRDSYSVHPVIHNWIRERPGMTSGERAVWCEAAATLLAQSILLPSLASTEADEELRRDLLPHVAHVLSLQQQIGQEISNNRRTRTKPWPVSEPRLDRWHVTQLAKFSLVYSQCGSFDQAETLQLAVREAVYGFVSADHPAAANISLALAFTYRQQSKVDEAAEIQRQVLQTTKESFGPDHTRTLEVMVQLGASRSSQGRYQEALDLLQTAVDGLTRVLGPEHKSTLLAIDDLGRATSSCYRYEEAKILQLKVVEGMEREFGPMHLVTLVAKESLAMTYLELGGPLLDPAHEIMEEVVEQRNSRLGKEHPYTLLAIGGLARVKGASGQTERAEALFRDALPIAERRLGVDHAGVQAGKVHLAQVLVRRGRYAEAEDILNTVLSRQILGGGSRDKHPDHVDALFCLLDCHRLQNKQEEARCTLEKLAQAIDALRWEGLGARPHVLTRRLQAKRAELDAAERGLTID